MFMHGYQFKMNRNKIKKRKVRVVFEKYCMDCGHITKHLLVENRYKKKDICQEC